MNETYELRNTIVKTIALRSADLLEYFQWGQQTGSDKDILISLEELEKQIVQLKKYLRD